MSITFLSQSIRAVLPRLELKKQDQRPGAYPVVSRTGDSTRTGRNRVYFDDRRTIVFHTGVNVSYPTTFQDTPAWVATDLSGTMDRVIGNVEKFAIEQFIAPREQVEALGPFREVDLFEQDETNRVNSSFMTGAAYAIAPDRFKSKLSNKTIIRLEIPLRHVSQLTPSSSIHYLNPASGAFIKKFDNEPTLNVNAASFPATFAPLPFTPYGMHYLPLSDVAGGSGYGAVVTTADAKTAYRRITTYMGDGSDSPFYSAGGFAYGFVTASVLNRRHVASVSESIDLSSFLSHPFLLEKAVVEFPFAAGPGWLNDRFGIRTPFQDDLTYTMDAGGPMVTFALMRQDKADILARDIIASGTITNLLDMTTGSYNIQLEGWSGVGGYYDTSHTPEGLGWFANPTVVVTGSELSGSANTYTGSIEMILEPQITSHVWRMRVSGSAAFYWGVGAGSGNAGAARPTQASGLAFGPIVRRSVKQPASSRNILGNHFALIDLNKLDGAQNPVKVMDAQYESLVQDPVAPRIYQSKIYHDVVSHTIKSPYLLQPKDNLVLCFSKHRAVGSPLAGDWDFSSFQPTRLAADHDVSILTGTLKLTLYGDLIKNDQEFHDTLNQRLETVEIWETIGEEPVVDQFDVFYGPELSGSYIDRFRPAAYFGTSNLGSKYSLVSNPMTLTNTGSIRTFSNFGSTMTTETVISTEKPWLRGYRASELGKSLRGVIGVDQTERLWDTRLIEPMAAWRFMARTSKRLLSGSSNSFFHPHPVTTINSGPSTADYDGTNDWHMTYPYEAKFSHLTYVFSDELNRPISYARQITSTHSPVEGKYEDLILTFGPSTDRTSLAQMLGKTIIGSQVTTTGGAGLRHFIIGFYGIGDGYNTFDNQHVRHRGRVDDSWGTPSGTGKFGCPAFRGWRYGLANGFVTYATAVFRRDRFGQFRDMLEQRVLAKTFSDVPPQGVKEGPVQVRFYNRDGNATDPLLTLSSNLSFEATSSMPYTDGVARNRPEIDYDAINISNVVL